MRIKDGVGVSDDPASSARSLRGYLYDKYVYRNGERHTTANGAGNDAVVPLDASLRLPLRRPV